MSDAFCLDSDGIGDVQICKMKIRLGLTTQYLNHCTRNENTMSKIFKQRIVNQISIKLFITIHNYLLVVITSETATRNKMAHSDFDATMQFTASHRKPSNFDVF